MISKRAYVSYVNRQATKDRMSKYNKKKDMEREAAMSGLLARKGKKEAKSDDTDMDAVLSKYIKVVREMFGDSDEA